MLTNTKIAKANAKTGRAFTKYSDRDGLVLVVYATGGKTWKWNYRAGGRQKSLTIGRYPSFSLAEAREICMLLRAARDRGDDPRDVLAQKNKNASSKTLRSYIDAVIKRDEQAGKSPVTLAKRRWIRDSIPTSLLTRSVSEIKTVMLMREVQKTVDSGLSDKARRTVGLMKAAFSLAKLEGDVEQSPASELGMVLPPVRHKHHPAITDPAAVAALLAKLPNRIGQRSVTSALCIAPHVFLRPGELRAAQWAEIDFDNALWTVPANRMKMRRDHVVPLSEPVIKMLRSHREFCDGELVFPGHGRHVKPISENSLNHALWSLGYKDKVTAHGFRTTASTLLNEMGWNWDWIETQLAHCEKNSVRDSYNRAHYLDGRRAMMERWSQFIVELTDYGLGNRPDLPKLLDFGPASMTGGGDAGIH